MWFYWEHLDLPHYHCCRSSQAQFTDSVGPWENYTYCAEEEVGIFKKHFPGVWVSGYLAGMKLAAWEPKSVKVLKLNVLSTLRFPRVLSHTATNGKYFAKEYRNSEKNPYHSVNPTFIKYKCYPARIGFCSHPYFAPWNAMTSVMLSWLPWWSP